VGEAERGLTRQRNVGIRHAKGEIVAFLDDDTVPTTNYFAEILACFQRHPKAVGVGGLITNETSWNVADLEKPPSRRVFRWGEWERRESFRWRLRGLLRLGSPLPPGWMPEFSHGRPAGYPPDNNDYDVEFVMGGASAWKKDIFGLSNFSEYFQGYGLYEDLDFCIRVAQIGRIYLCTRARLEHHHAAGGRPNQFKYGKMVVRNGWFVWRRRWPSPTFTAKVKWWLITLLLAFLRLIDVRNGGIKEAVGRFWGMLTLLYRKPDVKV
jgi:GT2 family glycosyltransferase